MSKYLSVFQTESQYNAAVDLLDFPNVSLIDTTGDIKYSIYKGKEIANADFGDIIMAEVATNKLFNIKDSEYNLTDYPLADYKPIAVCIYDKASNANNEAVFMSVQWVDYTDLGHGKPSIKSMVWGFYNVNVSSKVDGIRDTGTNHISSKSINTAMKPLVTMDYSGSSISNKYGDGESPAFCCCWRYSTPGTSEGDWYLPSYYDLMKYQQNYSTINNVLTTIKNVAGTGYISKVSDYIWTSSEQSDTMSYGLTTSGNFPILQKTIPYDTVGVRPVFITSIQSV